MKNSFTHTQLLVGDGEHSFIHSFIHPSIIPFIHSFIHSFIHLFFFADPKSGKKNVKLFKDRFVSLIKKEIKSELHDYAMNHWVSNVDQWTLSRLAHLLDSQGIPASEVATIDQNSSLLLWSWHYLLASYPAVC